MQTVEQEPYSYFYRNLIEDIENYLEVHTLLKSKEKEIWERTVLYLLYSLEKGNLCIDFNSREQREEFLDTFDKFNQKDELIIEAKNIIKKIKKSKANKFQKLFFFSEDERFLFFQKHYQAQYLLREKIKALKIQEQERRNFYLEKEDMEVVKDYLQKYKEKKENKELSDEQILAIIISLLTPFLIISGGPGTGKTTVASHIVGLHIKMGIPAHRIAIAAPTGRAAANLQESIKKNLMNIDETIKKQVEILEPRTIHRLLYFQPYHNRFFYHSQNLLNYHLILLDEASMIELQLMKNLFLALPDFSSEKNKIRRIILLGDKDQLPSVREGKVLEDLIPFHKQIQESTRQQYKKSVYQIIKFIEDFLPSSNKDNIINKFYNPYFIELKQSFRNTPEIKDLADTINQNNLEKLKEYLKNIKIHKDKFMEFLSCSCNDSSKKTIMWVEETNPEDILKITKKFVAIQIREKIKDNLKILREQSIEEWKKNYDSSNPIHKIYQVVKNQKILCPTVVGPIGIVAIHQYLVETIHQGDRRDHGIPVIITENDYYNNLYNGDIGVILIDKNENRWVCFEGKDGYIFYSLMSLHNYEISYAISIHKSQGGEYDTVLMVFPDWEECQPHVRELLKRQIVYTGVTRAKKQLFICSSYQTWENMVQNRMERVTGISLWE